MDGERNVISIEDRSKALIEYYEVVKLVSDLDSEMFSISYSEYLEMPEIVRLTISLWNKEKKSDANE